MDVMGLLSAHHLVHVRAQLYAKLEYVEDRLCKSLNYQEVL